MARWPSITRAAPFAEAGKRTPVFVRFSTVAGERGSADTARDVRGFAVKFYTDEGNWDLVGNNIPVFFIQDAMKFPDLVHAVKPEPHHGMPQAASAHDTFWDFVSLMPEIDAHADVGDVRPRHPAQLPHDAGLRRAHLPAGQRDKARRRFVKFHWKPMLGTHSLVWDEAAKIAGADADFHRRDLWEAIEAGEYPEWELGLQIFTEEQADGFSFDVLDATKLIPEELVPRHAGGSHGAEPQSGQLLRRDRAGGLLRRACGSRHRLQQRPAAGRAHPFLRRHADQPPGRRRTSTRSRSTRRSRRCPTTSATALHRQAIHRGRVAYEPNSLAGGCPFQAGAAGFVSFPAPVQEDKVRGKPEKFGEHYAQATLFYESQTPVERAHIAAAFRFELSKLTVPAIRERMLSSLVNVSAELAAAVAEGLGMAVPAAMPRAVARHRRPEVQRIRRAVA